MTAFNVGVKNETEQSRKEYILGGRSKNRAYAESSAVRRLVIRSLKASLSNKR
jgi:hypothetical protein